MKSRLSTIFLLLILTIAVFFRFYKLDQIPPGLYPDVAVNGTDAINALQSGDLRLYYPENNGREGLFINLIALSFWLFGPSVWAIKIVPAFFGILTVVGTYLLTNRLFTFINPFLPSHKASEGQNQPSEKADGSSPPPGRVKGDFLLSHSKIIALFSTFFLAISFWHVNFSRLGFRAIMVPFFLVWSLYLLIKATRIYELHSNDSNENYNKIVDSCCSLAAGLLFGLGFHTYISFRVAPLILLPVVVFDVIKCWPRPKIWRWLIFALGVVIAASPMIYYFYNNPADFMGRATQVSVFASENPALTLAWSATKTIGQFIVYGDPNQRHNISGSPQIFWPLIPFFVIGISYVMRQIVKRKNYSTPNYSPLAICYLLLTWWISMLLPSIFTNEGLPHALRSIGAIPPSYIFAGLGSWLVINKFKNQNSKTFNFKLSFCILIFSFLISTATAQYYRYFIYWGQAKETQSAFSKNLYDGANYLKNLPPSVKKYVIINEGSPNDCYEGISISSHTVKFIAPPETEFTWRGCPRFQEWLRPQKPEPAVFLPLARDEKLFSQLRQTFPRGGVENYDNFSVFRVNF